MKAEILNVGTELLLGHTINSDAAFVARELAALGIDLQRTQVVGDNPGRLRAALEEALSRSDIVICTGGLGPTEDDLTKETVAKLAGLPLEPHPIAEDMLREYFGDRQMTENQKKQALIPVGATVFPNRNGTAPGCAVPFEGGKFAILLPGPPRELLPMLSQSLRPFLLNISGGAAIHSTIIRIFGHGEGAVAQKLGALLAGANPSAATYAGDGELFARVSARGENEEKARALAKPLVEQILARLGDSVYGIDEPSLEHVAVRGLREKNMTIATAESCTGGLLAQRLTDIAGASKVFHMGLVTYSNEAKMRLLDVPGALLAEHGAVSPQVAEAMAKNVRGLAGSDFGIGITGIAGPDGGSAQKPVGLVYICLACEDGSWLRAMRPQGRYLGRQWTRRRAASHALDMMRRKLAGLPMEISHI